VTWLDDKCQVFAILGKLVVRGYKYQDVEKLSVIHVNLATLIVAWLKDWNRLYFFQGSSDKTLTALK